MSDEDKGQEHKGKVRNGNKESRGEDTAENTEGSEDTRDRVGDGAGDEGRDEAARVVSGMAET